jgi:hypothetical protein
MGLNTANFPWTLPQKTTLIHPSWHSYINPNNLPKYTPTTYASLSSTPLNTTKPPKRPATPTTDNIPIPRHIVDTPLNTMEIDGHKHLPRQTICHVSQWHTDHLSAKQLCTHINDGLSPSISHETILRTRIPPSIPYHSRSHKNRYGYQKKIYLLRPAGSKQATTIHEAKRPSERKYVQHPLSLPHKLRAGTPHTPPTPLHLSIRTYTLHSRDPSKSHATLTITTRSSYTPQMEDSSQKGLRPAYKNSMQSTNTYTTKPHSQWP